MISPPLKRPEERQARLLRLLAASSSFLFVLLAFLVVAADDGECASDHECARGSICLQRKCVGKQLHAGPIGPRCKVGHSCDNDDCEGLICKNGYLRRGSRGPKICENTEVASFFSNIETKCGNSDTCTKAEFKRLLISNGEFNRLLQESDTSFAIHFDSAKPEPFDRSGRSPAWNSTRAEYVRQLVPLMPGISDASSVILISTASKTRRKSSKSEELSLRRLQEARYLLQEAAKEAGLDTNDLRLTDTNVGEEWQRDEASYRLLSLSDSIFWDSDRGAMFEALIQDFDGATSGLSKRRKRSQKKWRDAVLNQAVFVIPNPCKQPSKSP